MALKKVTRPWLVKKKPKQHWVKETWSQDADFYNNRTWRRLAKSHKQSNPLCVECKKKGIIKEVEVTDHIRPLKHFPELGLVESNLQSLCHPCHNKKSAIEKNKPKEYFK